MEKIPVSTTELARKEGNAKVLLDGGPMTHGEHAKGCYLSPFIYRIEHRPDVRCIREEVFGPHVALIPFRDNADAARIYNDTDYGLSLAVVTEDYRAMRYFREECDYGMGYVNLPSIGAEVHLPFGGVKKSGNGHPSAAGLIESVTHKTSWTVNHGTEIKMAQGLSTEIEGRLGKFHSRLAAAALGAGRCSVGATLHAPDGGQAKRTTFSVSILS